MKIIITEKQMDLLREAMSVGPEGELNISSDEMGNIVGKKVGEVFSKLPGINIIGNKVITYSKFFEGDGNSFSAFGKAQSFLSLDDYVMGSMQMDYPIPFVEYGKTAISDSGAAIITTKYGEERPLVITKYDRLSKENWDEMDGAILPDPENIDFRDGNVYVIFFNFPG